MIEAARPATADDVPTLAAFAAEAVAEQRDGRGGELFAARDTRLLPADASLAAEIGDPGHLVLIGTLDEVPVGYAAAHVESLRDESILGVITDLYVEPGARAIGVGETLMDEIVSWCIAQRCRGIDSLALPGNRETKNFFESFGFTARAIIVHRPLATDPT